VVQQPVAEPGQAPKVIEYVAQAKECAGCGTVTAGELPAHVRARASYGPETCAQAANLVSGHHIPVYRATLLLCQLAGIAVSTGWMAGIRGKAAALVEASGFMDRARELLKTAPAVHADETPARAAGGTRYLHLACTRYLTCMHTGDRSAGAIDAGGVLPGYEGVIVRDGYAGYGHLTSALHAWCGVHPLRDLKGLHDFEPAQQQWASQMASLLIEARDAAGSARAAGESALDTAVLTDLVTRYRALAAAGLAANLYRHTATAEDARRLARRFRSFEDLICGSPPAPTWTSSPTTKPSGRSGPSRSSSAAQEAAGEPSKDSPSSPSSSPTYPPPPNGASANSTPSGTCSTTTHGYRPASNPPDKPAPPGPVTSRCRHLVNSYVNRIGPSKAVASVLEEGVQRAAGVFLHLVEFGAEEGVDLRGAGEPQPECDFAGSDEVIEMGEVAGRQRPMPGVAVDQRRPEVLVVVSVPQFPQRDGDVVEPVTESAVVEIDDPDLIAPEQRVVEVQIGVDEAEIVAVLV
jgi:transposase